MNPLSLLLLGGAGAGALFGGRPEISPAALERLFGAQALGKRTQDIFSMLASSPEFRASLGRTNVAGQGLGQQINANLARSGLLGTGVGAVGSALGESAGGFAREDLIGKLHQVAAQQGTDLNSLLANLYLGTRQKGPTPLQHLSGSVLSALGPSFLNRKPAGANNASPSWSVDSWQQTPNWWDTP